MRRVRVWGYVSDHHESKPYAIALRESQRELVSSYAVRGQLYFRFHRSTRMKQENA